MPPQPVEAWDGVLDASDFGPACPQLPFALPTPSGAESISTLLGQSDDARQSEDCLVLNVWTPGLDTERRAVMVRLHGGAFTTGSGSWPQSDGSALADRGNIVVVTVNHRINGLGFLRLDHLDDRFSGSGNAGMLDLVQMLEWVRANISKFGGDPENVTIFGESGGGAKVSVLMSMPSARGLFHRAIIQSGPMLTTRTTEDAAITTDKVLGYLGISTNTIDRIQDVAVPAILDAFTQFGQPAFGHIAPVLDATVLPEQPKDALARGASSTVPLLIGSNMTESTLARLTDLERDIGISREDVVDRLRPVLGDSVEFVFDAYARTWPDAVHEDLQLFIEAEMFCGLQTREYAQLKRATAQAPVYAYVLDWRSQAIDGLLKSAHSLEVPLSMNNPDSATAVSGTPGGRELAQRMSDAWIAFAKNGDPNTETLPTWPTFGDDRAMMFFQNNSRVEYDPFPDPQVWERVSYPKFF